MFRISLRKTTKVNGVLSAFHEAIADLKAVAQRHTDKAAKHEQKASKALADKAVAEAEATRATAIATQMEGVFN